MLLANTLVAEHLNKHFPRTALLRSHQPPDTALIEKISRMLKNYDIEIETTSAGSIHKSMVSYYKNEKCLDKDIVVSNLMSRPMVVS